MADSAPPSPPVTGGSEPSGEAAETALPDAPAGGRLSPARPFFRDYLEALLIAIIFAIFARSFVVQAFKIPSESMVPNLLVGDHLLVNKFIYGPTLFPWERRFLPLRPPRRGEVVVFKFPLEPSRDFIKRCVALPGDTIQLRDKDLYINDEPVQESGYAFFADENVYRSRFVEQRWRLRDNYGPYRVPQQRLFCMGDNRDFSDDSRFWGPVPRSHLKGRALIVYWSFERPLPDSLAGGDAGMIGGEGDGGDGDGSDGDSRGGEGGEVEPGAAGGEPGGPPPEVAQRPYEEEGLWNRIRSTAAAFIENTRWKRTFTPVR